MYERYENMEKIRRDSFKGGVGGGWSRFLIPADSKISGSHFTMVAENTLDPGSEIAYHAHENDDELFVIIEGEGLYRENDTDVPVGPGDMLFLTRGNAHGLRNLGEGSLRLLAVIAN